MSQTSDILGKLLLVGDAIDVRGDAETKRLGTPVLGKTIIFKDLPFLHCVPHGKLFGKH
jgi:hypothetical protein